ncbi:hypothetical protein J6590_030395 [Homalodisca vitripennis]|nr:hypothetical protein J6590_030395 [Homalodisca vitripennis]
MGWRQRESAWSVTLDVIYARGWRVTLVVSRHLRKPIHRFVALFINAGRRGL